MFHCKWDFCSVPFRSSSDLDTHLQSTHIAHEKAEDVPYKRRKLGAGIYFVLREQALADRIPLRYSQTTGDRTTTTEGNTTLSHPYPPSFPSQPPVLPSDQLFPHSQLSSAVAEDAFDGFLNFGSAATSPDVVAHTDETSFLQIACCQPIPTQTSKSDVDPSQPLSSFNPPTQQFSPSPPTQSQSLALPLSPVRDRPVAPSPKRRRGAPASLVPPTQSQIQSESYYSSPIKPVQPASTQPANRLPSPSTPSHPSSSGSAERQTSSIQSGPSQGFAKPATPLAPAKTPVEVRTVPSMSLAPTRSRSASIPKQSLPSPTLAFGVAPSVKPSAKTGQDAPLVKPKRHSGEAVGFVWGMGEA